MYHSLCTTIVFIHESAVPSTQSMASILPTGSTQCSLTTVLLLPS